MKKVILFLLVFLPIQIFAQYHFLRIDFSEPMDTSSLRPKINYTVFNSEMVEIPIINTGIIEDVDSSVVLVIPHLTYKTDFVVRVMNVKDVAGNLVDPEHNSMWFYFDGYDPNESKPYLIME